MSKVGSCARCKSTHQTLYYCRKCCRYVCQHCGVQMPEESFRCFVCRKADEPQPEANPKMVALAGCMDGSRAKNALGVHIRKMVFADVIEAGDMETLDALVDDVFEEGVRHERKDKPPDELPQPTETVLFDVIQISDCSTCSFKWTSVCYHPLGKGNEYDYVGHFEGTGNVHPNCPLRCNPTMIRLKEKPDVT